MFVYFSVYSNLWKAEISSESIFTGAIKTASLRYLALADGAKPGPWSRPQDFILKRLFVTGGLGQHWPTCRKFRFLSVTSEENVRSNHHHSAFRRHYGSRNRKLRIEKSPFRDVSPEWGRSSEPHDVKDGGVILSRGQTHRYQGFDCHRAGPGSDSERAF